MWRAECAVMAAASAVAVVTVASPSFAEPNLAPFADSGLRFGLREVAVLPDTSGRPLPTSDRQPSYRARTNFFKEIENGRRFVSDERGLIQELASGVSNVSTSTYLDLQTFDSDLWSRMQFASGNAAGLVTFEFHPEFNDLTAPGCGRFYTIHTEVGSVAQSAGFDAYVPQSAPGVPAYTQSDLEHHTVISEWQLDDPSRSEVTSSNATRREIMRVGTPATSYFHPFGDLQFRPDAVRGDQDFGLLYISGGDWGFVNGRGAGGAAGSSDEPVPGALNRLDTLAGTMIRIDPVPYNGRVDRNPGQFGDYGVPKSNPFAEDGDSETLGEIFAYGFRNGHRMAWDDGNIVVADIGQDAVEEVNIVQPGDNFGWAFREGTFVNGLDTEDGGLGDPANVFGLTDNNGNLIPDQDEDEGPYTYPIVQYDHDASRGDQAIAGGFVYRGTELPELFGKYVFGDLNLGRLYFADWQDMLDLDAARRAGTAPLTDTVLAQEIKLLGDELLSDAVFDITGQTRTDLRFGLGYDGELYLLTGLDGRVRQLVSTSFALAPEPASAGLLLTGTLMLLRRRTRRVSA
ncbi:MAG: PQQ-dependent sugar dehydrogenase [Planctomycetota bacterium]